MFMDVLSNVWQLLYPFTVDLILVCRQNHLGIITLGGLSKCEPAKGVPAKHF